MSGVSLFQEDVSDSLKMFTYMKLAMNKDRHANVCLIFADCLFLHSFGDKVGAMQRRHSSNTEGMPPERFHFNHIIIDTWLDKGSVFLPLNQWFPAFYRKPLMYMYNNLSPITLYIDIKDIHIKDLT